MDLDSAEQGIKVKLTAARSPIVFPTPVTLALAETSFGLTISSPV